MIKTSTAVFAVADVMQTVDFYVKVLGFRQHWLWQDPPTFGCIGLGSTELFLCLDPPLAKRVEGHQHFFSVEDVESLHERHRAAGAAIVSPLENKPWGVREYTVRDVNGYHLRFSGPEKYHPPPTAADALPAHIRLDATLPDYETYASLYASVGWTTHEAPMRNALANTLVCVLGTDTRDGQTIGIVRATGDGKSYMIWDVIVRPSHQGQKIGAGMVARTLEELRRRAPPGAFVGLFTGKPGFYETLGFKKDFGMHLAL